MNVQLPTLNVQHSVLCLQAAVADADAEGEGEGLDVGKAGVFHHLLH